MKNEGLCINQLNHNINNLRITGILYLPPVYVLKTAKMSSFLSRASLFFWKEHLRIFTVWNQTRILTGHQRKYYLLCTALFHQTLATHCLFGIHQSLQEAEMLMSPACCKGWWESVLLTSCLPAVQFHYPLINFHPPVQSVSKRHRLSRDPASCTHSWEAMLLARRTCPIYILRLRQVIQVKSTNVFSCSWQTWLQVNPLYKVHQWP